MSGWVGQPGHAHDRDAGLRLPAPAEVVGHAHRAGRVAGHGVDAAVGGARADREHRERLRGEAVEPLARRHRLVGVGVVAEPAPVALALDRLVGDRALDDEHERLELAAVGLEEPLDEVVGAADRSALEVDQRPVHRDLRQAGQRAERDLLDARLGGRGEGDGVAVAAQPGVDPQDMDDGLVGGASVVVTRASRAGRRRDPRRLGVYPRSGALSMSVFCTPSLAVASRGMSDVGELDVRASTVRDGVLRSCRRAWDLGARVGADWVPRDARAVRLRAGDPRGAWRSTTSPRWTTGAGRSCDRSRSKASDGRCGRTVPPTRRAAPIDAAARCEYDGGLGSAIWSCTASSRSQPRSTTSIRCSPTTTSGCPCPIPTIRIRAGHARRSTDPLPVPSRSAHRRHRRRMVGGRPPLSWGRVGHRRRAAGRERDDPDVVGARDRIPPDPCRGHRAQRARASRPMRTSLRLQWTSTSSIDVTCRAPVASTCAGAPSRPRSGSSALRSTGRTRSRTGRKPTRCGARGFAGARGAAPGGRADRDEAQAMIAPDVDVGRSSPDLCGRCAFLAPCLAMEGLVERATPTPRRMLATRYRRRLPEEFDETGLRTSVQRCAAEPTWAVPRSVQPARSRRAGDRGLADADPAVVRRHDGVDEDARARSRRGLTRRPR